MASWVMGILGMKMVFPALAPVTAVASMSLVCIFLTTYLDPLQSPWLGFRFRSSIMGVFFFKVSWCGGRPDGVRVLRNSTGYIVGFWSPGTVSELLKISASPGNVSSMWALMASTVLFFVVNIAREHIQSL